MYMSLKVSIINKIQMYDINRFVAVVAVIKLST
jgi:hypothetical protein